MAANQDAVRGFAIARRVNAWRNRHNANPYKGPIWPLVVVAFPEPWTVEDAGDEQEIQNAAQQCCGNGHRSKLISGGDKFLLDADSRQSDEVTPMPGA